MVQEHEVVAGQDQAGPARERPDRFRRVDQIVRAGEPLRSGAEAPAGLEPAGAGPPVPQVGAPTPELLHPPHPPGMEEGAEDQDLLLRPGLGEQSRHELAPIGLDSSQVFAAGEVPAFEKDLHARSSR
ncbi:MAG: hypothetical protein D6702_00760 [Planctomycetota bacterium]|nr:MAG: hypothetical protein D6702_00760 [Planctomycetota bacterium]